MKADFVFGFIQAMDGEKDPRILMITFTLIPLIIKEFPDFTRFTEVFISAQL
jgi:DNA repair/transcription protein MET18/MMS19